MNRIIIIFLCLTNVFVAKTCNCNERPEFAYDHILVYIKGEFKYEYDNRLFEISDFNYDNIDRIAYYGWFDLGNYGMIKIYLINQGRQEVLDAVEHINKLNLEFVYAADTDGIVYVDLIT